MARSAGNGAAPSASIAASSDILPYNRLFNSPISEAAIVATAIGYAIEGGRALVELMYTDFIGRAGDEIFNQLAKWQSMSAGALKLPVVLRSSIGSKYGAQHSQDWTGLVAHIPGLKVVYPATPYDAKGLLASSLASDDPVVFFESQRLYDTTELFRADGVPADYYRVPIGVPDVKREGSDVTILTVGPSLYAAVAAADELAARARHLGRDHRRPLAGAVRLRPGARLGEEDRAHPPRLRGERARLVPADARRQYRPLRLRRPQGAAARARLAQLDRARAPRWNRPTSRRPPTSSTSSAASCSPNRATIAAASATGTTGSSRASASDRGAPSGAKLH